MFGSVEIPVYCHMGTEAGNKTGCGDGGWTLAMKMNGTKVHFFQLFIVLSFTDFAYKNMTFFYL